MGAQMVIEAASKTSDTAGDGATTATILPGNLPRGLRQVASSANPMDLKRGIEAAVEAISPTSRRRRATSRAP